MSRKSRPVRLGVVGLPSELRSLRLGRTYAVVVTDSILRMELVVGTVCEALSARQPAVVIGTLPADTLMSMIAQRDIDAQRALRQRQLLFFRPDADSLARLQRAGTQQLLDEFDHFRFESGGMIVMAPGDALMRMDNKGNASRHVSLLRAWLNASANTSLLLLDQPHENLLTSAGFDGVAELATTETGIRWQTEFWRLPDDQIISPEFHLRWLPTGGLGVDTRIASGGPNEHPEVADAADEERVIATASVVRGEQRIPALWEIVDDAEALSARAAEAVAATVILETATTHRFRDLARTIHTLRHNRGPALKIVVYEVGRQLRQSQEQLLLTLGANVVVLGQGLDRLRATVAALQGQRYTRELIGDFGEAFTRGLPKAQGGYLAPTAFPGAVIDGARRAAALGLECVLLRFTLRADVKPLTALKALRVHRPGDLFTCGDQSIYLFLFGCWDHDADTIVDRLFTTPIAELFDAQVRFPTNTSAMIEANQFELRLSTEPSEDYSPRLESGIATSGVFERRASPAAQSADGAPKVSPSRNVVIAAPLRLKRADP